MVAHEGPRGPAATPGNYEIWYASDRVKGTFKSVPIKVT